MTQNNPLRCFAASQIELIRIPDELVAIIAWSGMAASMLAMRSRLMSQTLRAIFLNEIDFVGS